MVWDEVEGFLESRQGLLDAVVFSGGEPTLQRGLRAAMDRMRELGFKVGLHTAGCYPERLTEVLPLVDWVGLDIKATAESYEALTRVPGSGERAWQSLERLVASGVDHEVRVTVHADLMSDQDVIRLVRRIRRCGTDNVVLQKAQTRATLDRSLGPNAVDWLNDDRMALEGRDFAGLS
jgi:pyruvate formate lyase activating enzyme